MAASDFRINSMVRSILSRHWVDLKKIQIGCFRGTIRLSGELSRLGSEGTAPHEPRLMDFLDQEIRAIPDVDRVFLDVTNWQRDASGQWVCTDAHVRARPSSSVSGEGGASMVVNSTPASGSPGAPAAMPRGGSS